MMPPSPVWNQPSSSAAAVSAGLLPVALEHDVAAGEHLTLVVDLRVARPAPARRPAPASGPVGRRQVVPLGPGPVHGQQRRGLGQAVDLDELPAELGLDALDGPGGRRRTGDDDAHPASPSPRCRGSARPRTAAASRIIDTTAGAPHMKVTPWSSTRRRISAPSTLRSTTCGTPIAGDGVGHAPAVAVEHRQGVQVHVAVVHAGLPTEGRGVDPQVAVGHLDALGPSGGAARVVDGGGGVLVRLPRRRLEVPAAEQLVGLGPDHELASAAVTASSCSASSGSTSSTSAPQCPTM